LLVALALLSTVPGSAAEQPSGCDKFQVPIDSEGAVLTVPDQIRNAFGDEITAGSNFEFLSKLREPPIPRRMSCTSN